MEYGRCGMRSQFSLRRGSSVAIKPSHQVPSNWYVMNRIIVTTVKIIAYSVIADFVAMRLKFPVFI